MALLVGSIAFAKGDEVLILTLELLFALDLIDIYARCSLRQTLTPRRYIEDWTRLTLHIFSVRCCGYLRTRCQWSELLEGCDADCGENHHDQ